MDLRYLIGLIIDGLVLILGITLIPYGLITIYKDFRVFESLSNGRMPYIQSFKKTSKTKIILRKIGLFCLTVVISLGLAVVGIPLFKNIYSIAKGDYLYVEGTVYTKEIRKSFNLIKINGVEIKEDSWGPSKIKLNHKYKIKYIKSTGYCIKVEEVK